MELNLKPTTSMMNVTNEANASHSWETLAFTCNFRISKLAEKCHVSVRTLQRHFRKNYDFTLREWLREVRLEKSRVMLPEARCVKTVAYDLGYKQPSHFTRDFKQRYGIPPKMWMKADTNDPFARFNRLADRQEERGQVAEMFATC